MDRDDEETYEAYKREVWNNIKGFGDNTNYNHNFDINYIILINNSPGLDLITPSARYVAIHSWDLVGNQLDLSLIHISEPTGQAELSLAVSCL